MPTGNIENENNFSLYKQNQKLNLKYLNILNTCPQLIG